MHAHRRGGREQPTSQQRVRQVRRRFVEPLKTVRLRDVRPSEASELWKDVPDPMASFPSRLQFGQRVVVVALLRSAKAVEVERHSSENGGYSSTRSSMYA